jgi:hypothetical protein
MKRPSTVSLVCAGVLGACLNSSSFGQNVSVDPSGRYYRNSSGQPIFLIGYDAWAAAVDGYTIDHVSSYSGMMNQGSPYRINYIRIGAQSPRMSASSNPPSWNGLTVPCPYAVDGNNRANLNSFNSVFWNGLANQCALGKQKGVIVHVSIFDGVGTRSGPAWGYGGSWWNPANQQASYYPNPDTNSSGGIDSVGDFYRTSEFNNGNPAAGTISYYEKRYIDQVLAMLPGVGPVKEVDVDAGEREMRRALAIIDSMTALERRDPSVLNGSRRRRIANGSGTAVEDVNRLLKQFTQARKLMKQLGGGGGGALKRLAARLPQFR